MGRREEHSLYEQKRLQNPHFYLHCQCITIVKIDKGSFPIFLQGIPLCPASRGRIQSIYRAQ